MEWRLIDDNPNYEVSDQGDVRPLEWRGTDRLMCIQRRKKSGYNTIVLKRGGRRRCYYVHRLVALAFLGPQPSPEHEVAHYDRNPDRNSVDNLRWATRVENAADKRRHGTLRFGQDHPSSGFKDADIEMIDDLYEIGLSCSRIAAIYGVTSTCISRILRRQRWSHLQRRFSQLRGNKKLTAEIVQIIDRLFDKGLTVSEVSKVVGHCPSTVWDAYRRRCWRHVEKQPI